jgi:hypothetical protein
MSQAVRAMPTGPRRLVRRGMAAILAQGLASVPLALAVAVVVAGVPVAVACGILIAAAVALPLPVTVAFVVVLLGPRRLLGLGG